MSAPWKMIFVEFVDSRQSNGAWQYIEDMDIQGAVPCQAVGWLVHEDEDVTMLAQSIGDVKAGSAPEQMAGVLYIPTKAIIDMHWLEKAVARD